MVLQVFSNRQQGASYEATKTDSFQEAGRKGEIQMVECHTSGTGSNLKYLFLFLLISFAENLIWLVSVYVIAAGRDSFPA